MFAFVLLKWASGEDIGKLTVMDMSCIRGNDQLKFSDDGLPLSPDTVMVEWRAGKKPKQGWPLFDASILRASDSQQKLERELAASLPPPASKPKRDNVKPKRLQDDQPDDNPKAKALKKVQETYSADVATILEKIQKKVISDERNENQVVQHLQKKNEELLAENIKLKTLVYEQMPRMMRRMTSVLEQSKHSETAVDRPSVDRPSSSRMTSVLDRAKHSDFISEAPFDRLSVDRPSSTSMMSVDPSSAYVDPGPNSALKEVDKLDMTEVERVDKVEIFPGSGVMCEKMAWFKAKHVTTASQFARALLLGVFDVDTLLISSLKGGCNKRDTTADAKKPLDSESLNAIYNATMKRFPAVSHTMIGVAISQKLTEMRLAAFKKSSKVDAERE